MRVHRYRSIKPHSSNPSNPKFGLLPSPGPQFRPCIRTPQKSTTTITFPSPKTGANHSALATPVLRRTLPYLCLSPKKFEAATAPHRAPSDFLHPTPDLDEEPLKLNTYLDKYLFSILWKVGTPTLYRVSRSKSPLSAYLVPFARTRHNAPHDSDGYLSVSC